MISRINPFIANKKYYNEKRLLEWMKSLSNAQD